jgi:4-hydroxy-tetrahydrodipicolinate synthase
LAGDLNGAQAAQLRLDPIRLSLTLGTQPGGVKAALALLGESIGPCRGPVGPLPPDKEKKMRAVLQEAGLLK